MKNSILSSCLLLFMAFGAKSQNVCESGYLAFREGVRFELTNYDKKGKVTGIQKQKINSVEADGDGFKADVDLVVTNEKGKELSEGNYNIECRNGVLYMDMSGMFDPRSMAGLQNMEMEMGGSALEFPAKLIPGETLPDGNITMKASSGGLVLMTISMNVTNRKVETAEVVTTPAGTFECVKVSQDTEMNAIIKKKFRTVSWFAIGVGMVKSENLDDRGTVESSTVLTKFEK
jgi:hypothetical protein